MSTITLKHGDVLERLKGIPDNSIDAIVQDAPYNLSFMGKAWDSKGGPKQFQDWCESWAKECLRVLRPGGHLLCFGGTRTYHRLTTGIEDAGFDIRDCIFAWVYGTGFPKSQDVSKFIDKRGGKDVSWFGKWFKEWRESQKITQKEVARLFPSRQSYGGKPALGGLTGCVGNWESGYSLPTNEQFNLLCEHFQLPFESLEAAERQVIGRRQVGYRSEKGVFNANSCGFTKTITDVTLSETSQAKRWEGYGTALKPACEPIVMAQKPRIGTFAENVLEYGVGVLNIDACRIGNEQLTYTSTFKRMIAKNRRDGYRPPVTSGRGAGEIERSVVGRWPANVVVDEGTSKILDSQSGVTKSNLRPPTGKPLFTPNEDGRAMKWNQNSVMDTTTRGHSDSGGASRFFYCPKIAKKERSCDGYVENNHPTVKPLKLMEWLIQLVCPTAEAMQRQPLILDCFVGSGSTAIAAHRLGIDCIGIDIDEESLTTARLRLMNDWRLEKGSNPKIRGFVPAQEIGSDD